MIKFSLLLICTFSLFHCAGVPQDKWIRDSLPKQTDIEVQWQKYHWYFPLFSQTIQVKPSTDGWYSGPLAYSTTEFVAKALTQEGSAAVGTIHLEGMNESVFSLNVFHFDSLGNELEVPANKIALQFREKGIIVVPGVTKGSVVAVKLIRGPYSAINWWEIQLGWSVPVLKSVVRLKTAKGYEFTTTEYNGLEKPTFEKQSQHSTPVLVWQANRLLPFADLPYTDGITLSPKLLIVNRNNHFGTTYKSWQSIAKEVRENGFNGGVVDLSSKVEALAKQIGISGSEWEKASHILKWVQENMTTVNSKVSGMGLDALLEKRKGNQEQIASLLEFMYSVVGIKSEIYFTRFRQKGGLDPENPNPCAVQNPLIVITVQGKKWVAFPFEPSFTLGDYPTDFFNLSAMNLLTGQIEKLPPSKHEVSTWKIEREIHLSGGNTSQAQMVFDGPIANSFRILWTESLSGDPLEACRKFLGQYGYSAKIKHCTEEGLRENEKSFKINLAIENTGTYLEESTTCVWLFPDLFSRPVWFYDKERRVDYFIPNNLVIQETVKITSEPGSKLKSDINCGDIRNNFIEVSCQEQTQPASKVITRETIIHKGKFTVNALTALQASFNAIDRIREAKFTVIKN